MAAGRRSVGRAFRAVAVDTSALRDSRDYRLLVLGGFVSGLGTQLTLVALPYQVYVQTGSSLLVGLIGLAELIPLVALSLIGGALADRGDRRRLLMLSQAAMLVCSLLLALGAIAGSPPTAALFVLAGLAAAASAVDRPARSAMLPNVVGPERLRAAISFNYGLFQLTMVVGPALAGIIIGTLGLRAAYGLDAASFLVMLAMVGLMRPQPAPQAGQPEPFLRSVRSGLSFAARHGELMGSFAIDLVAMTFGMPRALFPALALTVYNAGPEGVGLLYAAVSAGAVVAALTTGWLGHVRRLGRIVVGAVAVWGASIALLGLTGKLAVAMVCLLAAGAADSVSAVCRSTIMQTATPDAMRGRMGSIFTLVVAGGPRLGDVESGSVAAAFGVQASVVSGGLLCMLGIVPVVAAFPDFWRYGEDDEPAAPA
ncbi:MAG: MFS transporter [Gaiellales bacterium]|jgi:MFS family permease|nr:MFS transporter [Gaiellales bacterium]